MITDNEPDELIFDFLEGNLSADEEEAFLMLKDESELFNRKVRLWQNTYIQEPLPYVESLEEKLFLPPGRRPANLWSRLYAILIVISLPLSGDNISKHIPGTSTRLTHTSITIPPATKNQASITSSECIGARDIVVKEIIEMPSEAIVENNRSDQSVVLSRSKPEGLHRVESPILKKIEIRKSKIQKPASVASRKKLSGRTMRQLSKKLRQTNRARKANELLKGKEPYVVPLNNNF